MNTEHAFYRPFTVALAATAVLSTVTPFVVRAGGVSAGTLIENTAVASFDDGNGPRTINSNKVTVRVDEILDVTLISRDPGPISSRPGDAALTFELSHRGNGPEAFRLLANPAVAGNDFDVTVRAIAVDSNGNGVYDAGVDETLTSPQTTAILSPDSVLTVFVLVNVPDDAADGQRSNVDLVAEATTGSGTPGTEFAGAGVDGGDAIVGATGALATTRGSLTTAVVSVNLLKSVALRDPFGGSSAVPGTVATFTIRAEVTGSGTIRNFVVTDIIPGGTSYAPGTLAHDGVSLTDATDADSGTASDADGIRVNLGEVAGGSVHAVTFDVTID
jgi:uncharacterized repeat protein (TIGR01451 family)